MEDLKSNLIRVKFIIGSNGDILKKVILKVRSISKLQSQLNKGSDESLDEIINKGDILSILDNIAEFLNEIIGKEMFELKGS